MWGWSDRLQWKGKVNFMVVKCCVVLWSVVWCGGVWCGVLCGVVYNLLKIAKFSSKPSKKGK